MRNPKTCSRWIASCGMRFRWPVVGLLLCTLAGVMCAKDPPDEVLKLLSAKAQEALLSSGIVPLGEAPVPAENPLTPKKVELGRLLYFDKRLSGDDTISCATCHDPKEGWAETDQTSLGIHEQRGPRNAPTVLDSAYYQLMFWDGRAASLEEQALGPIENPKEMGMDMGNLLGKLDKLDGYKAHFKAVFGDDKITPERIGQAIASFERMVVSGPSPFDLFLMGKTSALSASQVKGLELFLTKANCLSCHRGPFLTTEAFRPTFLPGHDTGRAEVTKKESDKGLFRTPTLRNVALTPPYFYDGSEPSLEAAVFHRANRAKLSDFRAGKVEASALRLTESEVQDLTEFMKALSGTLPQIVTPTEFPH